MNRFILIILFLLIGNLYAQVPIGALTYGSVNQPKFIVFDERDARSTDAQEILQANLNLNEHTQYQLNQQVIDKLDRLHQKYKQYYKGVKIYGGEYMVHYTLGGEIYAIGGNYYPVSQFNVTPTLNEQAALTEALTLINANEYSWENAASEQWLKNKTNDTTATFYPNGELLIYPTTDALGNYTYQLCYQFNIISSQPFNSEIILVNAINGNVVEQYTTFSHGAGDACTHYSGTTQIVTTLLANDFILFDSQRNVHTYDINQGTNPTLPTAIITDFEDPNDLISPDDWTCGEWMNTFNDHYALDAHWAAMMTYDYFKDEHNRDSYDNQGSVVDVYVHHQTPNFGAWLGTNLLPIGTVFGMAFGSGKPSQGYEGLVSLDIIAHEFGHAITQFTSNLKSTNVPGAEESGSINEALSDIWGAVVENWVVNVKMLNGAGDNDKDIWLAGEETHLVAKAERSMRDPKGFGYDPLSSPINTPMADTYGGTFYSQLRGKSGVMSHWFYLLSEGSSATDGINDNNDNFNFSGIGIEKAADIVYLAQTVYFTSLSNYIDVRQATIEAANDLYGLCSAEAIAVADAWDAVGVPVFSLASLPVYAACGELNASNQPSGIYDGTGYANIVVGTPSEGGEVYSGVGTYCILLMK